MSRHSTLIACLIALGLSIPSTTALAQTADDWGSASPDRRSNANANDDENPYEGPYVRFGVGVGEIAFDDKIDGVDVDPEASGGFSLSGGYRFLSWLAAEVDLTYLGGQNNVKVGNVNKNDEDSEFWAVTFGPKLYPLGALESESIPDAFQPYVFVGIGGGEIEIDDFGENEKKTFAARFILGFELWLDDQIGFYVEGGGFATDDSDIDGAGLASVGGIFRF